MKKSFFVLTVFILSAVFFFGCSDNSDEKNDTGKEITEITANIDEEVKKVFNITNSFRTGNEAFYFNKDNSSTTNLVGQLGTLALDEDLCKAAQIRANEIVSKFSHTRPNGTSCFTVLNELSISYSAVGENIAAGRSTGEATFTQWKEDNEDYSGQGHRRNMLGKNFTRIGIAYAYDANSTYKYYWAMILAK
ncbi:MAG: CAP domain-containing protein [Treponema sp.]|uniref:CAP domain-containing protein n=1 Tax=Treponema sp. TaxID=166 RepID=UPI002A919A5C|nr:CAP domain-containing protein [Treponema sp.]MDY6396458.1 CAP domain-containing protein [Treponema sp.]